jgi:plasmid stabilization system protein ParE
MSYSYILRKQAQKDYEQSLKWYAERSVDAAEHLCKLLMMNLNLFVTTLRDGETSIKTTMKSF